MTYIGKPFGFSFCLLDLVHFHSPFSCDFNWKDISSFKMSPSAVDQKDVANLPLQLKGKQNGVENVKMEEFEKTDLVLRTFRCLIADLCHQFGCGHPGYVMLKH